MTKKMNKYIPRRDSEIILLNLIISKKTLIVFENILPLHINFRRMKKNLYKPYWEQRKKNLEKPIGKRLAVEKIIEITRQLKGEDNELEILDIGCGEGDILKFLSNSLKGNIRFTGLDKEETVIRNAQKKTSNHTRKEHSFEFVTRTIERDDWSNSMHKFDIIIAINTFHEIYTALLYKKKGIAVKTEFTRILTETFRLLKPNGLLLIFDGVESENALQRMINFHLIDQDIQNKLNLFEKEYLPIPVHFTKNGNHISCNYRDFTRFITKLNFIGSQTWEIERKESYQYYTEKDFTELFLNNHMHIVYKNSFIHNIGEWENKVYIDDPAVSFPFESFCIIGKNRYHGF